MGSDTVPNQQCIITGEHVNLCNGHKIVICLYCVFAQLYRCRLIAVCLCVYADVRWRKSHCWRNCEMQNMPSWWRKWDDILPSWNSRLISTHTHSPVTGMFTTGWGKLWLSLKAKGLFFVAYQNLPGMCLVCKHGSHVINIPKADWSSMKNKQLTATPC